MNMHLSEREWLDSVGNKFVDDEQGMLYAQLNAILRGDLDMTINNDHIEAHKTTINYLTGGFDERI